MAEKLDYIAVLIPCYNEEKTIRKVITDFQRVLPEAVIYVYNNNSTDKTAQIAAECGAIVRNEFKQGKGNVIRRMFREVSAQCYILVDGDDTYPAEYAREMADHVLRDSCGADMVVGDRLSSTYYSENKRPFHNVGNNMVRFLINQIFHADFMDILSGYRAFSYHFIKTFPVLSKGFEIETEMSIHAIDKNMYVENVVIDYRDRPQGSESKLDTFSDGIKVIGTIFRLCRTYKPMLFFGIIALVLCLISLAFFIPVLTEYLATGLVLRFPTLIVCGFTFIAAILSFFSGMLLDCIVRKNRQDFEMQLLKVQNHFNRLREEETK